LGSGVDPSASQKTDNFLDKTAVVPYLFSHVLEEKAGWPVPKPFRLAPLATGRRGAPEPAGRRRREEKSFFDLDCS
jgi:hypothetical protein